MSSRLEYIPSQIFGPVCELCLLIMNWALVYIRIGRRTGQNDCILGISVYYELYFDISLSVTVS